MTSVLRYGNDAKIRLELDGESLIADCAEPRGAPIDPAEAMARAIREPLDFPPLTEAIAPGDHVVLALGRGVPQGPQLIAPLIEALCDHGVPPELITILHTREDVDAGFEPPQSGLPPAFRKAVKVVVHDPEQRSDLAYLATTAEGQTIYLHRELCDADLAIPIGRANWARSGEGFAALEPLFPTFADVPGRERYAKLSFGNGNRQARIQARQEIREVGWLLGILFSIQVVPGGGGGVLDVVAGRSDRVRKRARELCAHAWNFSVPRKASLVVAAIEGDASEQTWDSVGRALAAASRAVADNGAIAVCSQLDSEPGAAIKHLGEAEDLHVAVRQIRKHRPADALPALQLAKAMDRARVYFLSGLDAEIVEGLGMAPIGNAAEIPRLAKRHKTCILLGNAQHAIAMPEADE